MAALLLISASCSVWANPLEFTLHKLESDNPGPTLLIIGGIQGDEPGGFTAASMLVTDYKVSKGQIWVVPNLNFESIIKRSRGVHGDMNRKFSTIPSSDPEFQTVEKIKSIIRHPDVDMVLNLHDGSGFYNPEYIDKDENPKRWGQSVVIDQSIIEADRYGDIERIANTAIHKINRSLSSSKQKFFVKNTHTSQGNEEMAKTLTYFAIQHGKPVMGLEASKNYPTHKRIMQHLMLVESLMSEIGIEFDRGFELSSRVIKDKLGNDIKLAMYDNKILFDFGEPRKRIRFVPMKVQSPVEYQTNNPLVAIINNDSHYKVRYGNRSVTTLNPEYFPYDNTLEFADFVIDGILQRVRLGTIIEVQESFSVTPLQGRRVNVIGYKHPDKRNETGITIKKKQISKRFSVDRSGQRYRVEFYRGEKYSGMVLVNFPDRDDKRAAARTQKITLLH